MEDVKRTVTILCFILTVLTVIVVLLFFLYSRITPIDEQTKKSKAVEQCHRVIPGRRECIFPEYYNSVIEFNSSTCRRENTFGELRESKSFYDRVSAHQLSLSTIHTNNDDYLRYCIYNEIN